MIRQYAAEQLDRDRATPRRPATSTPRTTSQRTVELVTEASHRRDEYDALETLGLETPNIAAGAPLVARERARRRRAGDASTGLPFFDSFALPSHHPRRARRHRRGGRSTPEGAASARRIRAPPAMFASFPLFMQRRHRAATSASQTWRERPAVRPTSPASPIYDSVIAMFARRHERARSRRRARWSSREHRRSDAQLAWTLAQLLDAWRTSRSTRPATTRGSPADRAPPTKRSPSPSGRRARSAVPVSRSRRWSRRTCSSTSGHVAREAAEEIAELDRTQRRWWCDRSP